MLFYILFDLIFRIGNICMLFRNFLRAWTSWISVSAQIQLFSMKALNKYFALITS